MHDGYSSRKNIPVHIPVPAIMIVGHELLRIAAVAEIYCSFDKDTYSFDVTILRIQPFFTVIYLAIRLGVAGTTV